MSALTLGCFLVFVLFLQRSHAAPTTTASIPIQAITTNIPVLIADQTAPKFVGYVGDPNGRGTASLVISCVLTLLLCVWSALHLNVPEQGQTPIQSFFVNVRWIIAGVFAPELVVFTAWRQWSSAKILGNLIKEMRERQKQAISKSSDTLSATSEVEGSSRLPATNEASGDAHLLRVPQKRPNIHRSGTEAERMSNVSCDSESAIGSNTSHTKDRQQNRYEWTMAHDFFASTGGFAFEIETQEADASKNQQIRPFLSSESPLRLTLTARGMALLARCGRLPDIAQADITDKSKANDVAKALVMIQASWMLVQVIGRLVAKMPVTLLEVNTIAHVMCAFFMYAMWWHKPLAPKEPFVLRGDWVNSLCAYMYMSSEISGEVDPKSVESQTIVKTLLAFLHLYSKIPELEGMAYHQPMLDQHTGNEDRSSVRTSITVSSSDGDNGNRHHGSAHVRDSDGWPLQEQTLEPAPKTCLAELIFKKFEKAAGTAFFERRPRVKGTNNSSNGVSQISINRWTLAAAAIESYPAIREHYLFHAHNQDRCLHFKSEELLVNRVQNWPWDDLLRDVGGLVVGMILWLACFAYGAVHLAAWNDHFPSIAEKWLWRSSSLYIGFCGGLWIVLNYIAQAYGPLNAFWEKWMDGGGRRWQNVLIGVPVVICGLSLIFARAFIVIEAFMSIRELPKGAYDTPTWTQIFPHL